MVVIVEQLFLVMGHVTIQVNYDVCDTKQAEQARTDREKIALVITAL